MIVHRKPLLVSSAGSGLRDWGCYARTATTRRRLACEAHAAGANIPADPERGRCPFSQAASFFRAAPPPSATPGSTLHASSLPAASLTPLGRAGGAEAAHPSLWLAAGQSGQDVPGRLTPGLRKLADLDEFLIEVASEMQHELALKKRAFEDLKRRPLVLVAEPDSLAAQAECLELFLHYLPYRYPQLYRTQGQGQERSVSVLPTGETHRVADFAACPLELCARIVQEDLVLMRADALIPSATATASTPPTPPAGKGVARHVMAAAAVVFSFSSVPEKLSQPLSFLHAPVPGFEAELDALINRTFASLRPDAPLYRNNWGLADTGNLDQPLYGAGAAYASRPPAQLHPESLWLKSEYQTLRRLPTTNYILFTVRTFTEPLSFLKQAAEVSEGPDGGETTVSPAAGGLGDPASTVNAGHGSSGRPAEAREVSAAATLARSLRGMTPAMQAYKGLGAPGAVEAVLAYLEAEAV